MLIIGLAGGSGSGKSAFCEILSRRGIVTVDCDELSHAVQEKGTGCFLELVERFGGEILFPDGNLDRKALASIVFSDEEALSDLNRIMHKHILDALRRRLSELAATEPFVVVEAPVLFESGFDDECDLVVGLLSERKEERIVERDHLTAKDARARLDNQLSDEELEEKCDLVLYNDSALLHLEEEADRLIRYVEQNLLS
ncbi:MAG: dephospho-CoA kinase [Clostridia bacterium]|nr:dephospho-CoA kinase [Clostridia bacterium]